MSNVHDLFDIPGATLNDKADRLEALKSEFAKSRQQHDRMAKFGPDEMVELRAEARKAMQKSLSPDQQAAVDQMFAEQASMAKDITAGAYPGVGSPGNLRPYDLEAPAKILVPRKTPILNSTPRNKGVGGAREYRRILGYTNAGVGGVPDQDIFFNSESNPSTSDPRFAYGNLAGLRRGAKISYAMDVHTAAYVEASVSDSVTYKAQFANLGFENTRDLSHMAMLWGHKLGEEKALLFGRGNSAQGYAGPFGGGSGVTPTAPTATSTGTSASIPAATYQIAVTVRAGVGESASTNAVATTVVGSGGNLAVTVAVPATGAFGTNVYATTGGVTNFVGFIPAGVTAATFTQLGAQMALAAPYASDTTSSNGYDGLLTVLTGPSSGFVNAAGGSISTNGDGPWQAAFQSLWNSVYADPQVVWVDGATRSNIGKWLRTAAAGAAAGYRLDLSQGEVDGIKMGAAVTGIVNQVTGNMVELRVHPYMPAGCSIIQTTSLDIPDSGVGNTSEVISVQEYIAQDWAPVQFSYDASTYWYGTFVHYAPAWSGAITGLTA